MLSLYSRPYPLRSQIGVLQQCINWLRQHWSSLVYLVLLGPLLMVLWTAPVRAAALYPSFEQRVLEVLRDHPEVILESVQDYQNQQVAKQQQQQQAFLDTIKADPAQFIGRSPVKGSSSAPVTLIEFSDFQCPFCGRETDTLRQFVAAHPDRVRLVFKHFPLDFHENAMSAANAAWAAGQQGKFWQFHDALFSHQQELGDALYLATAESLGLNIDQFNQDRSSSSAIAAIQADMDLAIKLQLNGTPLLVMNGKVLTGAVGLDVLEETFKQVS